MINTDVVMLIRLLRTISGLFAAIEAGAGAFLLNQ